MRVGCVAGASKDVNASPLAQARLCTRMRAADGLACLRGVGNQADEGHPAREHALFAVCRELAAGARAGCAEWLGRTFNVLENGRFDCRVAMRAACETGARRWREPLVTFA
jgi:hypothetical protein